MNTIEKPLYKTIITSNYQPRPLVYWEDVPEKVREEDFDYWEEGSPGRENPYFFKYKGDWYDASQSGGCGVGDPWEKSQHFTVWNGIVYYEVKTNEGSGVVVGYYRTVSNVE